MSNSIYSIIETLLFDYCCGRHSAKYVQKVLKGLGYHADLRGGSHVIDVFDNAEGICYRIVT